MYPPARAAGVVAPRVALGGLDGAAEARERPGHFEGVATVVLKLLSVVQPERIYLGQKDGMQCVVVRQLVEGFNLNTRVVVGETVRDVDGLALSSRNVHLSRAERAVAPAVYRALVALREAHAAGERCCGALRRRAAQVVSAEPAMSLEYVSVASTADGRELERLADAGAAAEPSAAAFASIAVRLGSTRLIDNVLLDA